MTDLNEQGTSGDTTVSSGARQGDRDREAPSIPPYSPEDVAECPVGRGACPDLPVAGPGGVVRHLLAVHPEAPVTRAIFTSLVIVQLHDVETAAQLVAHADKVIAAAEVAR